MFLTPAHRFLLPRHLRVFLLFFSLLVSQQSHAEPSSFSIETSQGEDVQVHTYAPGSSHRSLTDKPLLIWFTEGYRERPPFLSLISRLNTQGYEVWVSDLLESYFIERTPSNVRKLSGAGVQALLQKAESLNRPYVLISSGRMSLISLKGLRTWQLEDQPFKGHGRLLTSLQFFPNLLDAPEKAGDLAPMFPEVAASSLPMVWIQPGLGSQLVHLPRLANALTQQANQVWMVHLPDVRDWYFLRTDSTPLEDEAALALGEQIGEWISLSAKAESPSYQPARQLAYYQSKPPLRGLVNLSPKPMPPLSLSDASGQAFDLTSKKGKVLLVNFWATWCPPCVKEIPSMNRLAQAFDAKDFEIISVNFKESADTVHAFMQKVQVDFPVLLDTQGTAAGDWRVFAFPTSFLVNQQGELIASVNTAIEWDEAEVLNRVQKAITTGR